MECEIYKNIAEVNAMMSKALHLCTPCIVCDEPIPVESCDEEAYVHGFYVHNKICDKCKAAILHMREQMH